MTSIQGINWTTAAASTKRSGNQRQGSVIQSVISSSSSLLFTTTTTDPNQRRQSLTCSIVNEDGCGTRFDTSKRSGAKARASSQRPLTSMYRSPASSTPSTTTLLAPVKESIKRTPSLPHSKHMSRPLLTLLVLVSMVSLSVATCSTFWPWSQPQFECADKSKCIPTTWKCDDHKDCVDGSDEKGCERKCSSTQFKCSNGNCIPSSWRCDNVTDCADGSDEGLNCLTQVCAPNQFKCNSGQCIDSVWKCDGHHDCHDGSDELNPDCASKKCPKDEFKCKSGECIAKTWKCDHQKDCKDGSDELDCPISTCASNQYTCPDGKCIPDSWTCDGSIDCDGGHDEANCKEIHPVDHHLTQQTSQPLAPKIVDTTPSTPTVPTTTKAPKVETNSTAVLLSTAIKSDHLKSVDTIDTYHPFHPEDENSNQNPNYRAMDNVTNETPTSASTKLTIFTNIIVPIFLALLLLTIILIPLTLIAKHFKYNPSPKFWGKKVVKSLNFDNPVYRKTTTETGDQLLLASNEVYHDSCPTTVLDDDEEDGHRLATFLSIDVESDSSCPRNDSRTQFETRHA